MFYLIFSLTNLLRLWNWENWHSRLLIAASVLNGQQSSSTKLSTSWKKMTKHGFYNLQEISLKGTYAPYTLLKCLLLWKGVAQTHLILFSHCIVAAPWRFLPARSLLSLGDKLPCRFLDPFHCLCCLPAVLMHSLKLPARSWAICYCCGVWEEKHWITLVGCVFPKPVHFKNIKFTPILLPPTSLLCLYSTFPSLLHVFSFFQNYWVHFLSVCVLVYVKFSLFALRFFFA